MDLKHRLGHFDTVVSRTATSNTLLLDRAISRLQYLFVLAAKAFIDSIHCIKGIDRLIIGLLINKYFIKTMFPSL